MKKLLLTALLWSGAVAYGGLVVCPGPLTAANFQGHSGQYCGNVVEGPQSLTLSSPIGGVAEPALQTFLGYTNGSSLTQEFPAFGGSGALFTGIPEGSTVSFNWSTFFEPGTFGVMFYVVGTEATIVDSLYPAAFEELLVPVNQVSVTLGAGQTSFGLGLLSLSNAVMTDALLVFDPQFFVTDFSIDPLAVPEPATLGLTAAALIGLALLRRR